MISKGVPVQDHVEVWIDNKTGRFSELVYVIKGVGMFFRRNNLWVPVYEERQGQYGDTRIISLEKRDARSLDLMGLYDSGAEIDVNEISKYEIVS